jgi:membrane protein DedA with SNARE-associated domain
VTVLIASITGQLTHAVALHGVLAVAVIMAVDSVLPVGGEITMLFAGALASGALSQHASLFGVQIHDGLAAYVVLALAGTAGYVAGSAAGWLLGVRGGPVFVERYGRRLHLGPQRMARAERWFARFGPRAVFIGRLTPLVRSFVSIPAGVLRIRPAPYFAQTIAASLLWCFGFAGAGWALGADYDNLHSALRFLDYAGAAILLGAIVLAAGLWRRTRGEPAI